MKAALLLFLLLIPAFAQNPYLEKPTYARSHDFDLQHLKLDLSFDLAAEKLLGTATLRVAPLAGDLREIVLDSADLAIDGIVIAGTTASFRTAGDKLYVTLDRQYPAGAPIEIAIRYHAHPQRGLFFVMPDKYHRNRPKQIWANGDTAGGNNRFWFPVYDFPNDKTTTEMVVTVPAGWQTLSNGKLAGVAENKGSGTTTFHWSQDKPMSTYLVSLVAGEFEKGQDKWIVPVEYYVPRGRGADIPRTFGRTVDMLQFFSDNIAPYPWAKYDQSMVDTFGGGMENTSATTEGANAILDARDFDDRRPNTDSLIAHEMAHQWFGDLMTCADWRHAWLNEGFATYFEALWGEHAYGRDSFDWKELHAGLGIVSIPSRNSVVPHNGEVAGSSYGLIYNKGGWTLQMVRGQLGDARFWKAIQHYAKKYSYQNATTSDFIESITEATGQDLEWLFDQYVYQPGYPQFNVAWDYDGKAHLLHLAVQQTQESAPFQLPIEIEALGDSGVQSFPINVSKKSEDFYFGVSQGPRTVLFDPRDIILKSVRFQKPAAEWSWQLEHAARAVNRSEAALALGAGGVDALEHAGVSDPFYGVRIDAAESLGRIRTEAVRPALLKMLSDSNREVRAAAAGALGSLPKNSATIDRLIQMARADESLAVRRTALIAAARTKPDQGVELIKPFLAVDSPNSQMRAAAVTALQSAGGDAAVPLLLEAANDENDFVRQNALRSFGSLGKGRQDVTDRLLQALDEAGEKGDRQAAIFALMQRGDRSAIPALERVASADPMPNIANAAQSAVNALRSGRSEAPPVTDDLAAVRSRITELEKENAELKARLDRLEKH